MSRASRRSNTSADTSPRPDTSGEARPADTVSGRRAARPPATSPVPVRRAIAVLLSRFPLITETFILREIDEMERQGQPVRLVPLLREEPEVVHREALPWMERALFTPFLSTAIAVSNLRLLRRAPGRYLRTLWRVVAGTWSSWNFLIRSLALFPKAAHLAERLEEEGIRHLHAHFATHPATVALIISELTNIGFSFTGHAHDLFVRRQLLGAKLEEADFVRVISRFNRDFLRRRYPDLDQEIAVIPVGIEVGAYGPRQLDAPTPAAPAPVTGRESARSDSHRDAPLVVAVASLEPYKGLRYLVEACRLLRDRGLEFRCEIVGTGPLREPLDDRIRELGLDELVVLRGALPQHQVAELLGRARAFVLPSVVADDGQMEGLPVALMEAMASGCAVVTTRLSAIPELVEDRVNGLLVEPDDAAAIAGALTEILQDRGFAAGLAAAGRRAVASRHRLESSVDRLIGRLDAVNEPAPGDLARFLDGRGWPGSRPPDALGLRRLRLGADSRVAEVMTVGDGVVRDLVLKTHRSRPGESRAARVRARREYRLLRHLHEHGLEVPGPLGLDVETATILMEVSPGRSLEALLRQFRFRPGGDDALQTACQRAGHWLHRFQELAPAAAVAPEPTPPTTRLLDRASADVARCREAGVLVPGDRNPIDWMRILEESIRPGAVAAAPQHGDFWPGNVFVDGSGEAVTVVDFEGYRTGLRYEDVSYFLAHMELYLAYPLLGGRRQRLVSAFLDGFLAGQEFDEALFRFCRTAVALRLLARDLERAGDGDRLSGRHRRLLRALVLGD